MSIKDTLRLSVIASVLFSTLTVISLLYAATQINAAIQQGRSADAIVKSAYDLNSLTEEYLDRPSERVLVQWKAAHAHIGDLLDLQRPGTQETRDLLQSLREKHEAIDIAFISGITPGSDLPRLSETKAAQFRINSQAMIVDASRLAALNFTAEERSRRAVVTALILLVAIFAVSTITLMWLIYRRITVPLQKLREGAQSIAAGNMDPRIDIGSHDEFELVAESFNQMASKLKVLHHDLEFKIQELREQDEKKNTFISVLSHELRNPLAPIVSSVEYARHLVRDDTELRETLDVIGRQATNMKLLLGDLLDVSRMIHGKIDLRKEKLDLRKLIRDAVQTTEPLLSAKEQKMDIMLPEHAMAVHGDPLRIEQIVTNIISNASKYSPEKSSMQLSLSHDREHAYIKLRDAGAGVARDMQEKIFELFFQVGQGKTHEHASGFGIGLPLSRALAKMHGGTVTVESEGLGKGSTFTITLPLLSV